MLSLYDSRSYLYLINCMFADPSLHLGDLNKASGESWQALSQEEREVYIKRAAEEAPSCSNVELKQILTQLARLVAMSYVYVHTDAMYV